MENSADVDGNIVSAAASHWDEVFRAAPATIRDWLELRYIQRHYIGPAITGSADSAWFPYVCDRWVRGSSALLELGCGSHGVSFEICQKGIAASALGIDVSPHAIAISRERAAQHHLSDRLKYICTDLATADLGEARFDAIMANMALHHVLELEQLLAGVQRAKTSDAYFVVNEYVGPDRFQWTNAALREGQRLLDSLDERYRRHGVTGEVVRSFERPAYAAMVRGDASEAIRSSAIVPLLETYFEIVERRPYGGTLLQWLLADIAHNFDPDARSEDAAELDRLFAEERRLLDEGVLESNFTLIVAR